MTSQIIEEPDMTEFGYGPEDIERLRKFRAETMKIREERKKKEIERRKGLRTAEFAFANFDYDPKTGKLYYKRRSTGKRGSLVRYHKGSKSGYTVIFHLDTFSHNCLAWALMTGEWPPEPIVHLDGDPRNFRWSNLCLRSEFVRC